MIFVLALYFAFILLPAGLFVAAAVAEIRSGERGPGFFLRMAEALAGTAGAGAIIIFFSSEALSWTMVSLSLLLGILSLISKYASRAALKFMVIGSAILAFLWYFKGAYHH